MTGPWNNSKASTKVLDIAWITLLSRIQQIEREKTWNETVSKRPFFSQAFAERMREDLKKGNHISQGTCLKIRQMGNAEIHELRLRKATSQCPLRSGHVLEGLRFCKSGACVQPGNKRKDSRKILLIAWIIVRFRLKQIEWEKVWNDTLLGFLAKIDVSRNASQAQRKRFEQTVT